MTNMVNIELIRLKWLCSWKCYPKFKYYIFYVTFFHLILTNICWFYMYSDTIHISIKKISINFGNYLKKKTRILSKNDLKFKFINDKWFCKGRFGL